MEPVLGGGKPLALRPSDFVLRLDFHAIGRPAADAMRSSLARGSHPRSQADSQPRGGDPWLFFDLEIDPLEMCNLAGDNTRRGEIASLRMMI